MKRTDAKSHCPINFSLETFGDQWSLLIVRDIVCYGKQTYGEFLASKEGISSRVLAMRLAHLETVGILKKSPYGPDKRKDIYSLTEKGQAIVPVLIELATWGSQYDAETSSPNAWMEAVTRDKVRATGNASNQLERSLFFDKGRGFGL
jgi:DNA-binding HxlR family transcriptional regulator